MTAIETWIGYTNEYMYRYSVSILQYNQKTDEVTVQWTPAEPAYRSSPRRRSSITTVSREKLKKSLFYDYRGNPVNVDDAIEFWEKRNSK